MSAEYERPQLITWLRFGGPMAFLIAFTLVFGMAGQSVARPFFIGGCVLVMWDLLRFGAPAHMAGSWLLFCIAPFLRRVVDVHAGYEPSGLMISGPLLGLLVVAPQLVSRIAGGPLDPALRPFFVAGACTLYGTVLTIFDGSVAQAASGFLKWGLPLVYGAWLHGEARRSGVRILVAATRMAMWLTPLLGVYGFYQYVDPPVWDRFWMTYTSIASIGEPEPFMVRVFSTMNAPAGYATFTAAALLLFGFGRARFSLLLAAGPSVLGLMLSMYRTAWIALAAGITFGLFHRATWRRAAILVAAVPLLGGAVILFTPAGDALQQRLDTFSSVGDDASGQERLAEYSGLLNTDGGTLIGNGFGTVDVLQAGTMALDGQFIVAWYSLGLVMGLVYISAVCWAGLQAIFSAWRTGTVPGLAVVGIMVGALVQVPLASVATSEIGYLFWSFAAIGAALGSPEVVRREWQADPIVPLSRRLTSH